MVKCVLGEKLLKVQIKFASASLGFDSYRSHLQGASSNQKKHVKTFIPNGTQTLLSDTLLML